MSVGVISAPVRRCRFTCAPTQATSPSSATSARRPSPPRGISRCDSCLPPHYHPSRAHPQIPTACDHSLQVHMGTHMWTNPTSRRGRRMSLELPMRPGPGPGPGPGGAPTAEQEFMQRRPELFFPYLPPFFNGLPPKVSY